MAARRGPGLPASSSPPAPPPLPPLFRALIAGDAAQAEALLAQGADALQQLPGGVTAMHAAVLGDCGAAVPLLAARGVGLEGALQRPAARAAFPGLHPPGPLIEQQDSRRPAQIRTKPLFKPGASPLATACWLGKPSAARALLAAGAACGMPHPSSFRLVSPPYKNRDDGAPFSGLNDAALFDRPMGSSRGGSLNASEQADWEGSAAVAGILLDCLLSSSQAGADSGQLSSDELLGLLMAATLFPATRPQLLRLIGMAEGRLSEHQRRQLLWFLARRSEDPELIGLQQEGPLACDPIDPDGILITDVCCESGVRSPGVAQALLKHGAQLTLEGLNWSIGGGYGGYGGCGLQTLEAVLQAGCPLPAVPLGTAKRPIVFCCEEPVIGEAIFPVSCPLYTLLRRDWYDPPSTTQDTRVRMCQALLDAGYRPSVYRSIELLKLDEKQHRYTPTTQSNFNVLTDWDRLGSFSVPTTVVTGEKFARLCCTVASGCNQGTLLTADENRLLWMMVAGLPWTQADHKHFPPAFKAAVRTLLLAHRRSGSGEALPSDPSVCARPGCGATRGLRRCGGCGSVRYCGPECSRAHWKEHRPGCKRLQAAREAAGAAGEVGPFAQLPREVLLRIIAAAAFPVVSWLAPDPSKSKWVLRKPPPH